MNELGNCDDEIEARLRLGLPHNPKNAMLR